jgi:hypothetical protein
MKRFSFLSILLFSALIYSTGLWAQNIGMGIPNPQEKLHVNGAVIVGLHLQPAGSEVPGTISFSGSSFQGFNGTNWVNLDGPDNDWLIQGSPWGAPELCPVQIPASISMGMPGLPNQGAMVWLPDIAAPGIVPNLLMLESTQNQPQVPGWDVSMNFRLSDWITNPGLPTPLFDYTMGIFAPDNTFKLTNQFVLTPSFQADQTTMLRTHPSGIVDLNNQSRVRAAVWTADPPAGPQLIAPFTWTPVNFTITGVGPASPGPFLWDRHTEFTVAGAPSTPAPPVNAFFTATEEGYYDVCSRVEFLVDTYFDTLEMMNLPVYVGLDSYVTIAVYVDWNGSGTWIRHGLGNNLAISNNVIIGGPPGFEEACSPLRFNNAPNVCDVVYLQQNGRISIWVYHTALTPMNLWPTFYPNVSWDEYIYVAIHKSS